MNFSRLVVSVFALAFTACATKSAVPPGGLPDGPRAPLVITAEETSHEDGAAELQLQIFKSARVTATIQLELPPGVIGTVFDPEVAAEFVGERTSIVRLQWPSGTVPASDVRVIATMIGQSIRATATAHYRFGRPATPVDAVAIFPNNVQAGALRVTDTAALEAVQLGLATPNIRGAWARP